LGYKDDEILIKDRPSATYDMLLKKAEREGRIGGKHRCPICGMRFRKEREANDCCKGIQR
jgi:hypothetical protein